VIHGMLTFFLCDTEPLTNSLLKFR
jgi:hypothetical protein